MRLSQRDAATALGYRLKGYQELERGAAFDTGEPRAVPRAVMLACAAIAAGMVPYGSDEKPIEKSRPARKRTARNTGDLGD